MKKRVSEGVAKTIFMVFASFTIIAVLSITIYMILNGTPALFKVGIKELLFSSVWKPTADVPSYGILYVILTSIVGTILAVLLGVPIGVLTAVFLAEVAPKKLASIVKPAVELLAGIPSVIYHVCDMAELIMRIHMNPFSGYSLHLDGMVTATRELFMEAVNAFVEDNPSRSQKVIEGDDVIDMLFNKVKNDIIDGLKAELKNADEYIDICNCSEPPWGTN